MITATFQNLDNSRFDALMQKANELKLKFVSLRVEDEMYLNLTLQGSADRLEMMEDSLYATAK